jgi:O-antigen ligase
VALDNGGFDPTAWGWSTLLPLFALGIALALSTAAPPGRFGTAFLVLLCAFTAWTWFSIAWSDDPSRSVLEGERLLVYVAAAAAFVAFARSREGSFLMGLLAAIALVGAWALLLHVLGRGSDELESALPGGGRRLAAPVGYSNGLGLLAAIGILLAIGLAVRLRRVAFCAPCLVLLPVLYLTYSRGAWLALAAGGIAAGVLAVPRPPRLVLASGALVLALLVLAFVLTGGAARTAHRFSSAAPTVRGSEGEGRLISLSGSSRAQYWHVAWAQVEDAPWLGAGAGSFQRRWLRSRPAPLPVLDAHSLYLETLAELGPVGLILLLLGLGVPVAAAVAVRAEPLAAPAAAGYTAFLIHAAQDWDWELPAVTLAGLACAATLLALAAGPARRSLSAGVRRAGIAAIVAVALAAGTALLGNAAVAGASRALDASDPSRARREARRAERFMPWSPEPWRLHGEAALAAGDVDVARRDFRRALAKDDRDWDSWADLALVANGVERQAALASARRLNPREPDQSGGG